MTKDTVCGMQVDENKAPATSTHEGKKYSFCGQECKNKFDREPQRYTQQHSQQQHGQQQQGQQQAGQGQQSKQQGKEQQPHEHAHR